MNEGKQYNDRLLRELKEKIDYFIKVFSHNSGSLLQPKWVDVEMAKIITGMGKTWLIERQVRAGGRFNPKGIFRTRLQDKEIYFYKKDLDAYEQWQAGEGPEPKPIKS